METNKKKIQITGKTNVDRLTKEKKKRIRVSAQEKKLDHDREIVLIDNLVDEMIGDEYYEKALKDIENKINGYKQQDVKKGIYDSNRLISLNETVLKLQECELKCNYCCEPVKILYRIVREPKQWTLDRIDNDDCHSSDNTVIACLECNLKRRVIDKEKFEFTKKMKLIKRE